MMNIAAPHARKPMFIIDAVLDRNQFRGGLPYYDITIWPLRAGSGVMGGTRATVQVGGTASTERR
jgi:hypothetical protein